MGSPTREKPGATSSPEALARLVLRCRELAEFVECVVPELPSRGETPFLHGQLEDVLRRLTAALKPLAPEDAAADKGSGFLRRLAGKRPRVQRSSEARYDLEGNAWTIPVTELVDFLSHSGKSGLLWVTSSSETFVLEFSKGNLVHATSNAPPAAFRLGEILVREKLVSPTELEQFIGHAKAADDLLGSYLVRSGRIKHQQLQRVLAIQVQQLFHRLMDAENALYRFQEGAGLLKSQSLEVNITQLLLESARQKDEQRLAADARTRPAPPPSPQPRSAPAAKDERATPATIDVQRALVVLDTPADEPASAALEKEPVKAAAEPPEPREEAGASRPESPPSAA